MQDAETAVFLHEDVVDEVGRLLCGLHVLRVLRDELQNLVAARENTQQRRDHRKNGVPHLGHNDLRAAFLLVAQRIAEVKRHCSLAFGRNVAVDIGLAVLNGLIDDIPELLVAHGTSIRRQIAGFRVVRAIRDAIGRNGDQVRVVPAGGDAISRHFACLSLPATTATRPLSPFRGCERTVSLRCRRPAWGNHRRP